jgi:D-alanine-D-alanine ligase-like ATP-grasp enzyme
VNGSRPARGAVTNAGSQRVALSIRGVELVTFRDEGPTETPSPSHAVLVTVVLRPAGADAPHHWTGPAGRQGGVEHVFVRQGYQRNRRGRLPRSSRRLLEAASASLVDRDVAVAADELPSALRALVAEVEGALHRTRRRRVRGLDALRSLRANRRLRRTISDRLAPLRAAVQDVRVLAARETGRPRAPGADVGAADRPSLYVDGVGRAEGKAGFLASRFRSIQDYRAVPLPPKPVLGGRTINAFGDFDQLALLGKNGTKGFLYYYYALGFGLRTRRLSKYSLVASDATDRSMLFSWSSSQLSSVAAHAICVNKDATRYLLNDAALPTPEGRSFPPGDVTAVQRYADTIGYPVVTKPANGSKGEGVVVDIRDAGQLAGAIQALARSVYRDSDVIVERFIPGRDYRIVVVGDEVRGALRRRPASVTGDGVRTTVELMLAKHAWRMRNPHFIDRSAFIDESAAFGQIHSRPPDLERVPAAGEVVSFGTSCNLSQGADSIDVLDELHPSIRRAAVDAVQVVPGLRYCGVDLLVTDHCEPLTGQPAGIIELNAKAAVGNCEYPMFGQPREVVRHVIEELAAEQGIALLPLHTGRHRIRARIRGKLHGDRYVRWLGTTAAGLGVAVSVERRRRRALDVLVMGDLAPVAMLTTRLIIGPARARPTSVTVLEVVRLDAEGAEVDATDSRGQP